MVHSRWRCCIVPVDRRLPAGWLARYIAAEDKSGFIRFSDAAAALGIVDRAATRLPALGTWTERNRIRYLVEDDGLTKLAWAYRLNTTPIERPPIHHLMVRSVTYAHRSKSTDRAGRVGWRFRP